MVNVLISLKVSIVLFVFSFLFSLSTLGIPVGQYLESFKKDDKLQQINWGDVVKNVSPKPIRIVLYPSISLELEPGSVIKIMGQLITRDGQKILSEGAIQVLKGKLHGQIVKNTMMQNQLKVFGKKTLSSIRGTTFSIESGIDDELEVTEGEVEVEDVETSEKKIIVGKDQSPKYLIDKSDLNSIWKTKEVEVLSRHSKEAKRLQAQLHKEISQTYNSLQLDIKKSMSQFKGHYNQFKKSKKSQ